MNGPHRVSYRPQGSGENLASHSGTMQRPRHSYFMDNLDQRKEEALVYVSLSTATLIVCLAVVLALY